MSNDLADSLNSFQKLRGIRFSLVPQFDRYSWAVNFVQTLLGKITLLTTFSLLLLIYWPNWVLFIALCLLFFIFFPEKRHFILVAASLGSVLIGRTDLSRSKIDEVTNHFNIPQLAGDWQYFSAVVLVLLFCFLFFRVSRSKIGFPLISGRPVLTVITFYMVMAFIASYIPLSEYLTVLIWIFLIIFGKYIWFLSYSLCERQDPDTPPFLKQLGHYQPFWYPSTLPIPKGAAYIRKIKAKTPEELAVCQLKGLKLLIWAVYLSIFSLFIKAVCYGYGASYSELFHMVVDNKKLLFFFREQLVLKLANWPLFFDIPYFNKALELAATGKSLPFYRNWMALILHFFIMILHTAIVTHAAIAICRMAGYKALRNVHRPLSATTIAGFWNNYAYYFKEMLVTIFYYPTFLRYFKKRPILRYFAATMAAAGFGNFIYHLLLRMDLIVTRGLFKTIFAMQSMALYCLLIGTGIFCSQLRKLKKRAGSDKTPPVLATAWVLFFYCIISMFGDTNNLYPIADCFRFFFSLFNINSPGGS